MLPPDCLEVNSIVDINIKKKKKKRERVFKSSCFKVALRYDKHESSEPKVI
jgi:hypothetical protein